MEKWVVLAKRADFQQIGKIFSIDPVIARLIRNRDVVGEEAIREYLYGGVESLHPPEKMKDMERAVELLCGAIHEGARIRVIGDYDIDGIMSTYMLVSALQHCGAKVDAAIPDRIFDGYGLNQRLIADAKKEGAEVILTCDNGIAAASAVALAKELGLTVIVTDHHEVPFTEREGKRIYHLPPADAVVNPKQADCPYPFKGLCGGGVAFKLVQRLFQRQGRRPEEALNYLPYAAFATIGDVMELVGENRILVKEGLPRLRETENPGLLALIHCNGLEAQGITPYHIGFVLGPCLNASGRLDTAVRGLRLLQSQDPMEAMLLAQDLVDLNKRRKELTQKGIDQAQSLAEEALERGEKVLVLYLEDCHESLAGIIAGKIREKYHHPTFVLTSGEEGIKGSGRSIERYSMFEELSKVGDLFTKFGGHPMAAGVSMKEGDAGVLSRRLNETTTLTGEDFIPKIKIDVPMPLDYITPELIGQMDLLAPFGQGNPRPLFADKNILVHSAQILGANGTVCRMKVTSSQGREFDAVYFGDSENLKNFMIEKYTIREVESVFGGVRNGKALPMSFTYYPEIRHFRGNSTLQIVVKNYC